MIFSLKRPLLALAVFVCAGGAQAAPANVCQRYADLYRTWLAAHPEAAAEGPLAMAQAKGASAALAEPAGVFDDKAKLMEWAAAQKPPLRLQPDMLAGLGGAMAGAVTLDRAPGQSYYAASTVAGTAHCITAATFTASSDGAVRAAEAPPSWKGGACGVSRGFLGLDSAAVAYRDDTSFGPDLSARLSLSPWTGAGFGKSCTIRFDYAPGFSTEHLFNQWEVKCEGPRCPALKRAAIEIARDAKKDWKGLPARMLARLSPQDRAKFEKDDLEFSRQTTEAPTDTSPLVLLAMIDGQPVRVELGHFSIGWRVFGDWSVKFAEPDGKDIGSFGVGMGRGALTGTTIR